MLHYQYNTNMAPIIVLYGTSTSGKSSICTKLKLMMPLLEIDGLDLTGDKLIANIIKEMFYNEYEELSKYMDFRNILNAIPSQELRLTKKDPNHIYFLKDQNEFTQELRMRLAGNITEEEIGIISKSIFTLLKNKEKIREAIPNRVKMHEKMFEDAITKSRAGIPTILDLVPIEECPSLIDKFYDFLEISNHRGSVVISVVHCPMKTLQDRIHGRNIKAREQRNDYDIREGLEPFEQYVKIFKAGLCEISNNVDLGTIRKEDFLNVTKEFAVTNTEEETKKLLQEFGFPEDKDSIEVIPNCKFDVILNSQNNTSIELAQRLHQKIEFKKCSEAGNSNSSNMEQTPRTEKKKGSP